MLLRKKSKFSDAFARAANSSDVGADVTEFRSRHVWKLIKLIQY